MTAFLVHVHTVALSMPIRGIDGAPGFLDRLIRLPFAPFPGLWLEMTPGRGSSDLVQVRTALYDAVEGVWSLELAPGVYGLGTLEQIAEEAGGAWSLRRDT